MENTIWNSSLVRIRAVKDAVTADSVVDRDRIQKLSRVIDRKEIELFPWTYW